jgi:hypothetical protein
MQQSFFFNNLESVDIIKVLWTEFDDRENYYLTPLQLQQLGDEIYQWQPAPTPYCKIKIEYLGLNMVITANYKNYYDVNDSQRVQQKPQNFDSDLLYIETLANKIKVRIQNDGQPKIPLPCRAQAE